MKIITLNRYLNACYMCHYIVTVMVEHLLMERWVIGLLPHNGHIELFLIPASASRLV